MKPGSQWGGNQILSCSGDSRLSFLNLWYLQQKWLTFCFSEIIKDNSNWLYILGHSWISLGNNLKEGFWYLILGVLVDDLWYLEGAISAQMRRVHYIILFYRASFRTTRATKYRDHISQTKHTKQKQANKSTWIIINRIKCITSLEDLFLSKLLRLFLMHFFRHSYWYFKYLHYFSVFTILLDFGLFVLMGSSKFYFLFWYFKVIGIFLPCPFSLLFFHIIFLYSIKFMSSFFINCCYFQICILRDIPTNNSWVYIVLLAYIFSRLASWYWIISWCILLYDD